MYHILVAVDDNAERALVQANTISELPHADGEIHVDVLHVFGDNPTGASATQIGAVRRVVEHLDEAGIEVSVRESSGDPADTILDEAEAVDANLICIGGRKRTPAGKALFGSVTQSVILNAEGPVIVTGGRKQV